MHFALMIYYSPEEFALRKNDYNDPHLGAWHKSQSKTRCPLSAMSIRTCSSRLMVPGGKLGIRVGRISLSYGRIELREQKRPRIYDLKCLRVC